MAEKKETDLEVRCSVAEGRRKKDSESSNEVIVIVDNLSLGGVIQPKGKKIKITDSQKKRLINAEPVKIKEVKNV